MTIPYFLIIMLGGLPHFVLPMSTQDACLANAREFAMTIKSEAGANIVCFEANTQRLAVVPPPKPSPPKDQERVD